MSENVATFAITMTATGQVHDKDGNLLNEFPIEDTRVLTAAEVAALIEGQNE